MTPERQVKIGNYLVEEFYWAGDFVVYINNCLTKETFEKAIERLKKEENNDD